MRRSHTREQIEKELRARILRGIYGPGERLPAERDLSTEFSVSRATIQNALKTLTNAGLLVQNPNCRPVVASHASKDACKSGPQRSIAVWIQPNLEDLGATMILQGIRTVTEANGLSLVVGFPNTDQQQSEVEFLRGLVSQPTVVGAVVWCTCMPSLAKLFPTLEEAGIPIVFVDREPPDAIEADVVSTNNRRGALKAVSHLIRLGHRDIAMVVNTEPVSSVRDRIEGYREALRAKGLEASDRLLYSVDVDAYNADPDAYGRLVREIVAQRPRPTAIFCVHDGIALRIQQALSRCSLRVPEDMSLVGFDWLQRSLPYGGDLTTVAQPFDAIGRIAAERLLERIGATATESSRHILLEAPLVVRSTTAPPSIPISPLLDRTYATVPS